MSNIVALLFVVLITSIVIGVIVFIFQQLKAAKQTDGHVTTIANAIVEGRDAKWMSTGDIQNYLRKLGSSIENGPLLSYDRQVDYDLFMEKLKAEFPQANVFANMQDGMQSVLKEKDSDGNTIRQLIVIKAGNSAVFINLSLNVSEGKFYEMEPSEHDGKYRVITSMSYVANTESEHFKLKTLKNKVSVCLVQPIKSEVLEEKSTGQEIFLDSKNSSYGLRDHNLSVYGKSDNKTFYRNYFPVTLTYKGKEMKLVWIRQVVDIIIKHAMKGGNTLIYGPAGCGKTTLMRVLKYRAGQTNYNKVITVPAGYSEALMSPEFVSVFSSLNSENNNIMFFDEAVSLLKASNNDNTKNAALKELTDGDHKTKYNLSCIFAGSLTEKDIPDEVRRPGRLDLVIGIQELTESYSRFRLEEMEKSELPKEMFIDWQQFEELENNGTITLAELYQCVKEKDMVEVVKEENANGQQEIKSSLKVKPCVEYKGVDKIPLHDKKKKSSRPARR